MSIEQQLRQDKWVYKNMRLQTVSAGGLCQLNLSVPAVSDFFPAFPERKAAPLNNLI
jgi:hypothetical protein